jgi:hypothetical protein
MLTYADVCVVDADVCVVELALEAQHACLSFLAADDACERKMPIYDLLTRVSATCACLVLSSLLLLLPPPPLRA